MPRTLPSTTVVELSRWRTEVLARIRSFLTQCCRFHRIDAWLRSQFYVTFRATSNLDGKHTVFGKLVGGEDILDALEKLPRKDGTERPSKPIKIKEVVMCVHVVFSFWLQRD